MQGIKKSIKSAGTRHKFTESAKKVHGFRKILQKSKTVSHSFTESVKKVKKSEKKMKKKCTNSIKFMEKITEPANLPIKKSAGNAKSGPVLVSGRPVSGSGGLFPCLGACFDAREGQISTGNRPSPEIDDLDSVFSSKKCQKCV